MKLLIKNIVWISFAVLLFANVYVFISGVSLGEDINKYETETNKLKQENIILEKQAYEAGSLATAASLSASLDFTSKSAPIYLDTQRMALNR